MSLWDNTFTMNSINIKNRKSVFEYHLLDKYIAGIQLTGTEIKSIRANKANLADSYCAFLGDELWVKEMHIAQYTQGSYNNHEPKRDRKLLLNRRELKKLSVKVKQGGFTIVPVRLFIVARGLAKLDIALAKGKKLYDKREDLKRKDAKRDIERVWKK